MNAAQLIKRPAVFAALASLLAIGGAQAQIRSDGPVAVTSSEFESVGNTAVYRGQVQAIQGQTRLNCSELRIVFSGGGSGGAQVGAAGGDVQSYNCAGPVYYVTPTEQAKGDAAVFTVANDTIVFTGNVVVRQGLNVAQGERLTINTRTRNTKLESAGRSPRVRTVIYPDEENGGSARPAAAPRAAAAPEPRAATAR
jgi:lipopolysaccharide export system protein LptA